MKKFVCTICGYVHEGDTPPEFCPICKAPASKFKEQEGEKVWASEHVGRRCQGRSRRDQGRPAREFPGRML